MESSNNNMNHDAKLRIGFPKSNEDHRLQLVEINGSIFAIVFSPLESLGPIHLHCEEWSLVLLSPIKSKTNILVSAINIICLNEIASEEGNVTIHATNQLVTFPNLIKPLEKICEMGEGGEFCFDDEPGAFLQFYRLFEGVVSSVRAGNPDSIADAQQKIIMSLCTLADRILGKPENLDLNRVLDIWKIPSLKS